MPFTTSHPAIIMPLKKIWPNLFSLTGLMAGAMAPDLLYFILLITNFRGISHSWLGLFIFCLPAGVIFSFVFHHLYKCQAIRNFPSPFDRLLSGLSGTTFSGQSIRFWLKLVISVMVGSLSHFLWDSFTHGSGEIAEAFPYLTGEMSLFGYSIIRCHLLQFLSTIFGGLIVLWYIFKGGLIPSSIQDFQPHKSIEKFKFWTFGVITSTLFSISVLAFYRELEASRYSPFTDDSFIAIQILGLSSWAGLFYYVCVRGLLSKKSKS